MSRCPHCNSNITHFNLQEMSASAFMGKQWRTVVYVCPQCEKIISAQIDPIAIKADTVNKIKSRI